MTTTYAVLSEGLAKSFGKVHAVRGLDLAVAEGSVCGLLGPNGAGKTTAVRLLTTLLRPDAGSARVAGHDLSPTEVREVELLRREGRSWREITESNNFQFKTVSALVRAYFRTVERQKSRQ